jgi:hypothetical protein
MKMFPILMDSRDWKKYPNCPRSVPWELLAPHEKQAQRNHDQSLETLASRCGLSPTEMVAILEDRRPSYDDKYEDCIEKINQLVKDFNNQKIQTKG